MHDGKTKNLAVIGDPIEHTFSPFLQNLALHKLNLNYHYTACLVKPKHLSTAISGLKALNFAGFNVTIPHKKNILPFLDEISPTAKLIGAVNTVVQKNGKLYGYNTDSPGFLLSLQHLHYRHVLPNVTILGTGGAARAVVSALLNANFTSIGIVSRQLERSQEFCVSFPANFSINLKPFTYSSKILNTFLKDTDLLINTTPLGMPPYVDCLPAIDLKLLPSLALVFDCIYNPICTPLLKNAQALNLKTSNGAYMLAAQGALALEKWTGLLPDIASLYEALLGALRGERQQFPSAENDS